MKITSVLLFLVIIQCQSIMKEGGVPLKVHINENKRNDVLNSLKIWQSNIGQKSFLQNKNKEKDIELKKQINAAKRLATYYGLVGVGKGVGSDPDQVQVFKMMFDTGSCEFWLQSDSCTTAQCESHNKYKKSNTFRPYYEYDLGIQYLSGSVTGKQGYEIINVDGIDVPNQIIGVADVVNIPLLDDVAWDGIIGLAFANHKLQNRHISPFMDTIIQSKALTNKGLKNIVGYYLGDTFGSVSFGKIDNKYLENPSDPIAYAALTEEYYWSISLIDVRKVYRNDPKHTNEASSKIINDIQQDDINIKLYPQGCKAIIDTGTYLIYGPSDIVQNYLSDVVITSCDQKQDLPNLIFEFLGQYVNGVQQRIEITLTPQDYVLQFNIDGNEDCVIGIGPDPESEWTLGQVFLKSFYSIYDRDEKRVGFIKSKSKTTQQSVFDYDQKQDVKNNLKQMENSIVNQLDKQFNDFGDSANDLQQYPNLQSVLQGGNDMGGLIFQH